MLRGRLYICRDSLQVMETKSVAEIGRWLEEGFSDDVVKILLGKIVQLYVSALEWDCLQLVNISE